LLKKHWGGAKNDTSRGENGLDPQEGLAKSYKIGDVENRVWCELVKLHTIDEKKSTKELMGRERKSVQKKIKEHHPESHSGAWGCDQC
jgi:hypothetical protein